MRPRQVVSGKTYEILRSGQPRQPTLAKKQLFDLLADSKCHSNWAIATRVQLLLLFSLRQLLLFYLCLYNALAKNYSKDS